MLCFIVCFYVSAPSRGLRGCMRVIALPDSTRWYRLATIEPSKWWPDTPVSSALLLNGRSSGTIRGHWALHFKWVWVHSWLQRLQCYDASIVIESYWTMQLSSLNRESPRVEAGSAITHMHQRRPREGAQSHDQHYNLWLLELIAHL
jgi:hypothetical protein